MHSTKFVDQIVFTGLLMFILGLIIGLGWAGR